jgi:hypothetical protein
VTNPGLAIGRSRKHPPASVNRFSFDAPIREEMGSLENQAPGPTVGRVPRIDGSEFAE